MARALASLRILTPLSEQRDVGDSSSNAVGMWFLSIHLKSKSRCLHGSCYAKKLEASCVVDKLRVQQLSSNSNTELDAFI